MLLSINNVSKTYRNKRDALRNLSLELRPGIVGLLGPNGAGKSTLMRILTAITRPSSGCILWNGQDIATHRRCLLSVLGYLPQDFGVYPHLTAWEFLDYMAAVKGIPASIARRRISELLEIVNLTDASHRALGGFSGGMRQRVGIVQALLNDPELLIVDEPTGGLDPEERVRFRNLLSELSGERIVILSTHIVSDVEAIASDIAIIARGRLLAHESPQALLKEASGKVWEMIVPAAELPSLRAQQRVSNIAHHPDGVHVRIFSESCPSHLARSADPSLEDAYLAVLSTDCVPESRVQEVA